MKEILVFLEFEDETASYINACRANPSYALGHFVIPLSLSARLLLKANGIPFHVTLPFFDSFAHSRALIRSEEWLKQIEGFIQKDAPLAAELCFCLRPLLNYLLWLSEIIANATEKQQPFALCGSKGRLPKGNSQWKLVPNERYLGCLLDGYAQKKGIHFEAFDMQVMRVKVGEDIQYVTPSSRSSRQVPFGAGIFAFLLRRYYRKRETLLLGSGGYGLGKVVDEAVAEIPGMQTVELDTEPLSSNWKRMVKLGLQNLKSRFKGGKSERLPVPLYLLSYDSKKAAARTGGVLEKLESLCRHIEGEWREQFRYRGFDLAPLVTYKLRGGISRHFETLMEEEGRLSNLMKTLSPGVVFSPYSGGVYTYLGHMCGERSIPAVMVTHGTHIPPSNRMEEIEHWRLSRNLMLAPTYRYTAAQTPWAVKHARFYGLEETALKTGPLLYARTDEAQRERLRGELGIPAEGKLAVYAVTQRKRSSVKFHVFETEDEYLQDMVDLVEAVNGLEGVYLVLKLHPSSEFSDADIRSILPSCERLTVLHREPFVNVLSAADLLVSYSSTTIEEALLNRIPVVLYDRWKRYRHLESLDCDSGKEEEWPVDASYYVTKPHRLGGVLNHALKNGEKARQKENLYKKHLFGAGEFTPLSNHIRHLLKE